MDLIHAEKLVVHGGTMHADDVMCAALMMTLNPGIRVIRSNVVTEEMENDDHIIVCDIGKKYDPAHGLFDHHQSDAPSDSDGHKYAAVGLLAKELEKNGCHLPAKMKTDIRNICDLDNGREVPGTDKVGYSITNLVRTSNPVWDSKKNPDECFIDIARKIQKYYVEPHMSKSRELISVVDGEKELRSLYAGRYADYLLSQDRATDEIEKVFQTRIQNILVFPQYVPFVESEKVCRSEAEFAVFPSNRSGYILQCIPKEPRSFEVKNELPDWNEHNKPEGLEFLYGAGDSAKTRFMAVFKDKNNAIMAAQSIPTQIKEKTFDELLKDAKEEAERRKKKRPSATDHREKNAREKTRTLGCDSRM